MKNIGELSEIQLDALKETINIGMCQASSVLAKIIAAKVMIKVPNVRSVPLEKIYEHSDDPETLVAGVYLCLRGEITGYMLLVFPQETALRLAKLLVGLNIGKERREEGSNTFSEIDKSALKELGNIFANVCINVLAEMTGTKIFFSVPHLAIDMFGAVADFILCDLAQEVESSLIMETEFEAAELNLKGNFLIFPKPESLKIIRERLEV